MMLKRIRGTCGGKASGAEQALCSERTQTLLGYFATHQALLKYYFGIASGCKW